MVRINGENLDVVGKSVADYLDSAGYDRMRVAVELNSNIVPKAQYCDTIFKEIIKLVVSFLFYIKQTNYLIF